MHFKIVTKAHINSHIKPDTRTTLIKTENWSENQIHHTIHTKTKQNQTSSKISRKERKNYVTN